jgi:PAS domain-containing protein
MNTEFADRLMMRVDAAHRRLTDLDSAPVITPQRAADAVKVAVREVDQVQKALRTTTEQLHLAVNDLEHSRQQLRVAREHYAEFLERMPMACLLTNVSGSFEDANKAAGDLLNVGPGNLIGKAMFLFLPERDRYFQAIDAANDHGAMTLELTLRPRERKPRPASVTVFALRQQRQYSWLILTASQQLVEPSAST